MNFTHVNMAGTLLAADLVNLQTGEGWTIPEVEAVFRDHSIRRPTVDKGGLLALRRWTTRLRAVFLAKDDGERCHAINALLLDGVASVHLSTHDNTRPHLHFTSDDDDVAGRVIAVTASALAMFTVEAGGGRLGVCASASCPRVFVDTSRNGRRAYCSARCGNTDAVRRHRARLP